MQSSASFSLPRRTSVRRRLTIGSPRLAQRIPPSPDCSRYKRQSVPTPSHRAPSDHTTRAAKMVGQFAQEVGSPPAQWSPSAIEVLEWVFAAAASIRERDWPLRRRRVIHKAPCRDRGGVFVLSNSPRPDAARTLAPHAWYPDSGPSIQKLCQRTACREEGIARSAGSRGDAKSRTTSRRLDRCAVTAVEFHSYTRSGACGVMISRGASFSLLLPASAGRRRTEVRRSKLKLALPGKRSEQG